MKGKDSSVNTPENVIIGRNPVMEALKSGRGVAKIIIAREAEGSVKKIAGMAKDKGIPVRFADRSLLNRIADGGVHQGVAAYVSEFKYCEPEDILKKAEAKGEEPFIVILNSIEDPHNLGAILRTADGAGAHGVIIPRRRAAAVTASVEKASAGAAEYVSVARVANIAQTIDMLKEAGVWVAAVDMDGEAFYGADMSGPIAVVVGGEGSGIGRLVKEKCDFCVSVPMRGGVNSLNASNAAAVLMYEVVRQRESKSNAEKGL